MLVLAQACSRARPKRLVDEDQLIRIEIELAIKPVLTPLQDIRPVLLARMRGLFLRVIRCLRKNRQRLLTVTRTPRSPSRA